MNYLLPLDKGFNPDQPRVPAGNSTGGQFAGGEGSGNYSGVVTSIKHGAAWSGTLHRGTGGGDDRIPSQYAVGEHWAGSKTHAGTYGADVKSRTVSLKNPYVFDLPGKKDYRTELSAEFGTSTPREISGQLIGRGYDALVVRNVPLQRLSRITGEAIGGVGAEVIIFNWAAKSTNPLLHLDKMAENQPRVPAGSPEGGQFASAGGGGSGGDARVGDAPNLLNFKMGRLDFGDGDFVSAYHGTSSDYLSSIRQKGLTFSSAERSRNWRDSAYYSGERNESIYVTSRADFAENYARNAAKTSGGTAIILEVKIPRSEFSRMEADSHQPAGALFRGTIEPKWIVGTVEMTRASKPPVRRSFKKAQAQKSLFFVVVTRPDEDKVKKADDQPRTLYVQRRLLNGDAVRAWAAPQGIKSALAADDMHVTVAFSREPVDWSGLEPMQDAVAVVDGTARSVHQFPPRSTPNGALVLKFESPELHARWQEFLDAGASWDFPEYQPHITITYSVAEADVGAIEPYRGPLIFGPEEFAEVDDGWAGEVEEEPTGELAKYNPNHDERGRFAEGSSGGGGGSEGGGPPDKAAKDALTTWTKGAGLGGASLSEQQRGAIAAWADKQPKAPHETYRGDWVSSAELARGKFAVGSEVKFDGVTSFTADPIRTGAYGRGGDFHVQFVLPVGEAVNISRWSVYPQEQEHILARPARYRIVSRSKPNPSMFMLKLARIVEKRSVPRVHSRRAV